MPGRSVKSPRQGGLAASESGGTGTASPTPVQLRWLRRGLEQAGGKLPLFDEGGREMSPRTIRACVKAGWAEPWFSNPIKPDWLVCRLTEAGRAVAEAPGSGPATER